MDTASSAVEFYAAVIDSPVGPLGLGLEQERLKLIDFLPDDVPRRVPVTAAAREVAAAVRVYFENPHAEVSCRFAVSDSGTAFQHRVWQALRAIPAGETRTYGEVARALGSSARAVGGACRANPIPILVPCHRVIAVNGLGGFAGDLGTGRTRIKRWLLSHEGARIPGG